MLTFQIYQLIDSAGQVVLEFVRYADERVESGKLSKSRLIIPGGKRLIKWAASSFRTEDSHGEDNMGDVHGQNNVLQLGEAYTNRKDPEHLPPTTTFEKITDKIRMIPTFFRSSQSAYGFRVACAAMTVGVIDFLHDTQHFFIRQRLVWAMIMVTISMSPTSGQSVFGFFLRIIGTVLAMVLSFLVWYIVDEKTPGVIVFLFLVVTCGFWVPLKIFRFRVIGIISVITTTMIIGYELQVRKVGEQVATSNGQVFYPIYLLAPNRLAAVTGGIAVAFIWTFFPYPISEHSALRQSLGASLYLLANYHSIIHETVLARMRGGEEELARTSSAGRKLEKARNKVFSKQMLMLNGLREYSSFTRWEVQFGGKFPKKQYDAIILCIEKYAPTALSCDMLTHQSCSIPQSPRLRCRHTHGPQLRPRQPRQRVARRFQETSRQRQRHHPRSHLDPLSPFSQYHQPPTTPTLSQATETIQLLEENGGARQGHPRDPTHQRAGIRCLRSAADLDEMYRRRRGAFASVSHLILASSFS